MAIVKDSATFFQHGNSAQFDYVLKLYPKALKLKAETRGNGKKADKLLRLEKWYQNELPKVIKNRGRDAHLLHEELVQTMEWKQTRGKFYPQLSYLIKINTPRAVVMETKKAFRKLPNLEQALNALSNLKGVGITMASALLAAAAPESAPFMADECLMAIPDIEGIDYTTKEYLKFVTHIQQTMDRLNLEEDSNGAGEEPADEKKDGTANGGAGGGSEMVEGAAADGEGSESAGKDAAGKEGKGDTAENGASGKTAAAAAGPKPKKWSAHSVELALWTHYVVSDLQPELLGGMPGNGNGVAATVDDDAAQNGISKDEDEDEDDVPDEEEVDGDNGIVEDEGNTNDENSRTAMMESSESESNEVAAAGVAVVSNGKSTSGSSGSAQDEEEKLADDTEDTSKDATDNSSTAVTMTELTNNGTSVAEPVVTSHTQESTLVDDGTKASDESLGGGTLGTKAALSTASSVADSTESEAPINTTDSSSNGSNKRPLCCEDNGEDKPELSAPKLIKL
ncbi:secreted protein C-like [Anopheles marshallii]|uniref:secreted protein C-like n=1 Tax=Anopheles marshallii TaxID=1521116 RepID=UPI00237B1670|nr:secreted protein C-like [Anopheles marshallii]